MAYLTDTSIDNYNHLKETHTILIKNFDWKALHCEKDDQKCLQSRVTVIRKIEQQLNALEREFKMPRTKHASLSKEEAKKRILKKGKS